MYEELLVDKERMHRTANKKIFVEPSVPIDLASFRNDLERIARLAKTEDMTAVNLLWNMIEKY